MNKHFKIKRFKDFIIGKEYNVLHAGIWDGGKEPYEAMLKSISYNNPIRILNISGWVTLTFELSSGIKVRQYISV